MKKKSKRYYRYLCNVAEEMNDSFKSEGSRDRAIVIGYTNTYQIVVLKFIVYEKY